MTIHHKIAETLASQAREQNNPLASLLDGKTTQQICHTIFMSYRESAARDGKGLRLSDVGLQLMKAFFKCHDVTMPPGYHLKMPHLIYMDRVNNLPYWISDKYCAMFDSDLVMMLRMVDGNIQALIDIRYRLTGDGQSLNADK